MKDLKKEAAMLEFQKASSARDSELLNNQIIMMCKTPDSTRLDWIILKTMKTIMRNLKIRKTVEEKVNSILSNSKILLSSLIKCILAND